MRKAFAAVLLLCLLGGCREERLPLREEDGEGEVQITLSFAPGPRSRSIYSGVGDGIDDICLWVFREGRLEDYRYLEAGADAVLSLLKGRSYSFYAIANAYDDLGESTLPGLAGEEELKGLRLPFSTFNMQDRKRNMPMASVLEDYAPSEDGMLSLNMERLFSRIVFRFEADEGMQEQNASLKSVSLKNSAMDIQPFVRNSLALETADGDCCTDPFNAMSSSGDSLVFYCLENCCGISENSDPRLKTPEGAPSGQPSYLELRVSLNGSLMSGEMIYRFCLGGNNSNDYNLIRDHSYSVTLRSLYSSVDSGLDDWQISGDVLKGEGTRIGLYLGQFRRFKLSDGDRVEFYDPDLGSWQYFIGYSDDDMVSRRFSNGICMASYYSEENGSSCNPDFYIYSTAAGSDETALVRICHGDGSEDKYSINPPAVPYGFSDLSLIEASEDGYDCSVTNIALNGRFGEVEASEFRIPEHYRYADLPCSGNGTMTFAPLPLPDCLMDEWRESFDSDARADEALDASWVWSLFDRLYLKDSSGAGIISDSSIADCMGCYADYLSVAGKPRICFYGKQAMERRDGFLENSVFSQEVAFKVDEAFPDCGYLGECFNREFLPNGEQSSFGLSLPAAVSRRAEWRLDEQVCARVASGKLSFDYPLGSKASAAPAAGPLHIRGRVVNRFTSRIIDGAYEVGVIICLPLICTEYISSGSADSFTLSATVAVASDECFYDNINLWEDIFGSIFNSDTGVKAQLSLGAENRLFFPYPDPADVEFEVSSGVDPEGYGPEFLARYAAANLSGFLNPADGSVCRSLDLYPTAYARLLLFEDVNTEITPAVDVYGQGNRIFECLWGRVR